MATHCQHHTYLIIAYNQLTKNWVKICQEDLPNRRNQDFSQFYIFYNVYNLKCFICRLQRNMLYFVTCINVIIYNIQQIYILNIFLFYKFQFIFSKQNYKKYNELSKTLTYSLTQNWRSLTHNWRSLTHNWRSLT